MATGPRASASSARARPACLHRGSGRAAVPASVPGTRDPSAGETSVLSSRDALEVLIRRYRPVPSAEVQGQRAGRPRLSREGEEVGTQAPHPRPLSSLPGLPFKVCVSKPCGREAAAPPGDPPSEPRERLCRPAVTVALTRPPWGRREGSPHPVLRDPGGQRPRTPASRCQRGSCRALDGAQAAQSTGPGAGGWRVGLQPQGSSGRDATKTQTPAHPTLCPPWIWGNRGAWSRRPEEGLQPSCLKFKVIKILPTTRFPQPVKRLRTHRFGTARGETPQGESFLRESAVTKTAHPSVLTAPTSSQPALQKAKRNNRGEGECLRLPLTPRKMETRFTV